MMSIAQINRIIKVAELLLLMIFLAIYVIRFAQWLIHPISNSYEEYGTVATMNSYLQGINPFSFESFPEKTFIYGPLFAWLCAFLYGTMDLQLDHMLFCRIVAVVFLLGTENIALRTIYRRLNSTISRLSKIIFMLLAFASILAISWQITPISGYSNTFGVFLTAVVYAIVEGKDRHKFCSLTICSLLSVLAFFIKPYFIMVFGVALAQLTIQKKYRQTVFLEVTFGIFALIAFLLCQTYMPSCLYVLVEAMSHQQMSLLHDLKQWGVILLFYAPFMSALLYLLKNEKIAFHQVPATYKSGVLIAIFCLVLLAANEGAYLWYFYHLMVLPLTICGVIALSYIDKPWTPVLVILCMILSVYHVNMKTICPTYPKEETNTLISELDELGKKYDLSKSYNFHASLDSWAAKNDMKYVNSLYPNFLLMMTDISEVVVFQKEHEMALPLLKQWEKKLKNSIANKEAELIFCKSDDKVLLKCGIDKSYRLLKTLNNPDGDPKYSAINVYIKR